MARKKKTEPDIHNEICVWAQNLKEAIKDFDLEIFEDFVKRHCPDLYKSFRYATDEVKIATMAKTIVNRTDMFGTRAYNLAVKWLREHNMRGEIY